MAKAFLGALIVIVFAAIAVAANYAGNVSSKYFLQVATLCTLVFMIPPLFIAQMIGFILSWSGRIKLSCACSLALIVWPICALIRDGFFPIGGLGSGYQVILYGFIFVVGIASLAITFLVQFLGKLAMIPKERS